MSNSLKPYLNLGITSYNDLDPAAANAWNDMLTMIFSGKASGKKADKGKTKS